MEIRRLKQSNLLIHLPAVLPDLAVGPSERRDVAHFDHRFGEVVEEEAAVVRVEPHQSHRLGAPREEHLVGVEQPPAGHQIIVVGVVEPGGAHRVQREEVVVAAGGRAPGPKLPSVALLQRGIGLAAARLVVQPLPEAGAAGQTDGVATCIYISQVYIFTS